MLGERLKVVSEGASQLKLEDGTCLAKSHQNKTWRWFSEDVDIAATGAGAEVSADSRLHHRGTGASMTCMPEEPPSSVPSAPSSCPEPSTASVPAHGADGSVPSIDELLAAIDRD